MKSGRFREFIGIIAGFIVLFVILLVERIGILYETTDTDLKLLKDDQIVYMKEAARNKTCLLLWDSQDAGSVKAFSVYKPILTDMRVPYNTFDINDKDDNFGIMIRSYNTVVIAMNNLEPIGKDILKITEWVGNGGKVLFGVPPFKSEIFDFISSKLGVVSSKSEYALVNDFVSEAYFMLGAQNIYSIEDGYESALSAVLDDECSVYAHTSDNKVPLVWSRNYQDGKFVICNYGYTEKAYRGIFSSAYTLLDDVFIYPVINASTFYLDDFPSPVPSGDGQYVKRDYNMGIADFYSRVWWPDMLSLGEKHDIRYTGLIIETYKDTTSGQLPPNESTSNYYYYGNLVLNQGGELGYHGYNHQPLCLENFEYSKELGYKKWEDYETMKDAMDELIRFSTGIFPNQDLSVYVPPSNILSDEGRQMLGYEYPQVKTIASIYLEGSDEYVQEFEVSPDGIVETPRLISGGVIDDYMKITAFCELNFHFVCSHFIHPDDLLDEDRGASLGWAVFKERIDEYMTWIDESGKDIRHLTGSEMAGAVQRYVNIVPEYSESEDDVITLSSKGLIDTAYYLIRVNDGEIANAYGGELVKLNDTLYLLKAHSKKITITRR